MKTKLSLIIFILAISASALNAQSKTSKTNIKVFGNCGMCKKRIETALDHTGIKVATWNTQTKDLEVVYNNRRISAEKIHDLVAATGHDTEKVKAKDEVYAKLPFCCLYRDHDHSNIVDDHNGHDNHR